ncbi:hypothetical protein NHX12_021108 [Muraenolepis orangiensis]|uniref:Neurotransmitter-gated ion-channel transmembrane domain-containing protein n=1 Tax=Muraenolepis orangiensis TaxID=630683 RepID=A0A9Q0EPF9_9TELE|nr:hypothetical protein NHX12_021108 [Muraenolepis orangiensis]
MKVSPAGVSRLLCLALCLAGLVAVVTGGGGGGGSRGGGRNSGRRKNKEVFLGEKSKFKFGGFGHPCWHRRAGGEHRQHLRGQHDAYNENDLMLYWKNGNDSLRTDEIVLSQFFIEEFHSLYIHFILRRHIFFFMLQAYFPTMLMVLLSWVSFWIDRRAVPARVSLGMTTVLTMSTIITGVSYVKAVDVYLWTSFLFVFLSVIEYAAIPSTFNASQAMAFDGCFHDDDMDDMDDMGDAVELTPYPGALSGTLTSDPRESLPPSIAAGAPGSPDGRAGVRLCRRRSLRGHVDLWLSNSYMIDSYSRMVFPLSYLLFNVIYWSLYS